MRIGIRAPAQISARQIYALRGVVIGSKMERQMMSGKGFKYRLLPLHWHIARGHRNTLPLPAESEV